MLANWCKDDRKQKRVFVYVCICMYKHIRVQFNFSKMMSEFF